MSKLVNILLQKSQSEFPWGITLGSTTTATNNVHITWLGVQYTAEAASYFVFSRQEYNVLPGLPGVQYTAEAARCTMYSLGWQEYNVLPGLPGVQYTAEAEYGALDHHRVYCLQVYSNTIRTAHGYTSEPDIVSCIKKGRLRELGHVERMPHHRVPRKVLYGHPGGARRRGRPRIRWLDDVERDLRKVDDSSLASEHLQAGDRVLEIEGIDASILTDAEIESLLNSSSKKLELLVMKRQKSQSINTNGIDNTKCSRFYEARVQTSERTVHQSKSCEQSVLAEKKNESVEKMKGDQFWTRPPADLEVTIMKQTSEAKNNYQERKMENDSGKSFVTESMIFHSLNNYNNKGKLDPREEKRKFWENCRKNESVRRFKWGDSIKPIRISSPLTTVGSSESLYSRSEKIDTKHQTNAKIERSKSCEPNDWMGTNPFFADVFPLEGLKHEIMVKANNPFMANERLSSSEFRNEKSMSDQNIRDRYAFASNNDLQCKETSFQIDDKLTNTGKDSSGTKYYSKITTNDAKSQDIKENSSKEEFNVKCEFFEKATSVPISCVNENAKGLVEARLKEGSSSCPNSSFIWPTLHSTAETDSSNMAATSNKSPQFEMPTKERSFYASPTPKLPAHSSLKKPSHFIALQRNSPVEIRAEENLPSTVEKTDNQEMYGFQEHKKRTLTQSSYEKIIRDRSSPYENVESSSRREYKEEELIRPLNIKDRSSTPSGFYDNHFEEVYQEIRSASPAVCVLSDTFEEIRSKVGNLLGGTPLVWKARPVHYPPEQGIEEAFQELAAKEGLVGDISSYDLYYDQFTLYLVV
uniref:PDZ domain-containing protein n=1 Tax=Rhodnius prolixus TaxID=13249 RepID=T1HZ85_RHOPR